MENLVIPEFKSSEEFVDWAKKLSEKDIQSFTAKNWVEFYDKLDNYVINSAEFEKIYQEKLPELVEKGVFQKPSEQPSLLETAVLKRRTFTELDGTGDMLCKLNRNYRFEPEQLNIIRRMARVAGAKLAENGVDAAAVAVSGTEINANSVLNMAQIADDLTIQQTEFSKHEQRYPHSTIHIDEKMSYNGVAQQVSDAHHKIALNPNNAKDEIIHTAFHESAHAHLQAGTQKQIMKLLNGEVANPALGTDFHTVMGWNGFYYITPERAQRHLDGLSQIFSYNEMRAINKRLYNSYHKQPKERYSEIYGIEAERSFRKASGQKSERAAMRVAQSLEGMPVFGTSGGNVATIGKPTELSYKSDGIHLNYEPSENISTDELLKNIEQRFAAADDNLKKQLNIHRNVFGQVDVRVPTTYTFKRNLENFLGTPPPLPPLTNENIVQDLPPIPGKNVKQDMMSAPSSAGNRLATAKEAAADAMDKVEQKLAAKGSVKAAAMTAEQVAEKAAKKSGILAQAATANAKFDKAIDKAVDKSAEVLNNTAVGKAYDKAAKAVGETKVAKAVGKAAEKVGEKAAQTAVGKAVTKTVAKTAGTAVGKSVLKKIPLVSLGAGMWFAWDRLKDGDWKGACGEVASGALGCIPGLGTAASTAIDVGLAAKDITAVVQENKQAEKKQEMLAQAQLPKKVTAEMKAEIAARGEVKAETKEPKEKEISAENAVQLAMAQKAATR